MVGENINPVFRGGGGGGCGPAIFTYYSPPCLTVINDRSLTPGNSFELNIICIDSNALIVLFYLLYSRLFHYRILDLFCVI